MDSATAWFPDAYKCSLNNIMEKTFQRKGKEKKNENDIESDDKTGGAPTTISLLLALFSWRKKIKLIQGVLHDVSR